MVSRYVFLCGTEKNRFTTVRLSLAMQYSFYSLHQPQLEMPLVLKQLLICSERYESTNSYILTQSQILCHPLALKPEPAACNTHTTLLKSVHYG